MARLKFGIFMGPFHTPLEQNPTLAYRRDVDTVRLVDRLGFDEAWIGEHHSCGVETIGDPMLMLAHLAPQTERIKLGTGVVSLPYHNPLWTAERILFLDHLTRGRVMLGVGSGALPSDAAMIGLDVADSRGALEQDLDVVMHLIESDEPISVETGRYRLVDAQLQLAPFSDPLFDIAVTAVASPSGPRLAGKHGVGMLSFGATEPAFFELLHKHWQVAEERAAAFGKTVSRSKWRHCGPMHLAETKEQAIKEVEYGFDSWCDYRQTTIPTPMIATKVASTGFENRVNWLNESGVGVIGTPDEAIAQIRRLEEESGGFGCYLLNAHEWASWEATQRSYELFARYVMPHFQGSFDRLKASEARGKATRDDAQAQHNAAVKQFTEQHAPAPSLP